MSRPFAKYEGLGNDFIVLDGRDWPLDEVTPELAVTLCDRHTGIGGDGILWMGTAESGPGDARLVILNADGSRPEMCGNGVRCVAAWLHEDGRLATGDTLRLDTDAGPRPTKVLRRLANAAVSVEVEMGAITLGALVETRVGGTLITARAADAGNPHAVIFDRVDERHRLDVVRALAANREVWPRGVNVEFCEARSPEHLQDLAFTVAVHERGVGWTQACGTGACAVAAVAVANSAANSGERRVVGVTLAGGELEIAIVRDGDQFRARMTGPARCTFHGTVPEGAFGERSRP